MQMYIFLFFSLFLSYILFFSLHHHFSLTNFLLACVATISLCHYLKYRIFKRQRRRRHHDLTPTDELVHDVRDKVYVLDELPVSNLVSNYQVFNFRSILAVRVHRAVQCTVYTVHRDLLRLSLMHAA